MTADNPTEWADSDGDGVGDNFETAHGLNNGINDALLDLDEDGFCNLREFLSNTDPTVSDIPLPIADIDDDNDIDAVDLSLFGNEFGRADCAPALPCIYDFDNNGVVDQVDFKLFSEDYGRAE